MMTSEICTATVTKVYNQDGINLINVKRDDNKIAIEKVNVLSLVAGPKYGTVYVPPVGQQVLVAILDVETQMAVCLGCLYNNTNQAPFKVDSQNSKMYLKYGKGWNITLDSTEGKEKCEVKTAKNDVMTVDQAKRLTTIKSSDGKTKIEMDFTKGSISIEALKEITLSAGTNNKIQINPTGVKIQGSTNVNIGAANVSVEGKATASLKGATATVKGNASTMLG